MESKQEFWDEKILRWEHNGYRPGRLWGVPLRYRRELFLEIAGPRLQGLTVLELGCGSAALIEDLFKLGIKRYIGCDFSSTAIRAASERASALGLSDRVELVQNNAVQAAGIPADFCFSLGLLDWLDDAETLALREATNSGGFLHSFSESRVSIPVMLHKAYVYAAYGNKTGAYVPRYRSTQGMASLLGRPADELKFYRDGRMSFSTFAYDLPARA